MDPFNPQAAERVSLDLSSMFDAVAISTDEHGVHRDESGREHRLVDIHGETTFKPVEVCSSEQVADDATDTSDPGGQDGGHVQWPTGGVAAGGHLTSWDTPSWADVATSDEDLRVEFVRSLGTVFPVEQGEAPFSVAVRQTDTVEPGADVVVVERGPARVSVLGLTLTPAEARELAALLVEGAELAAL